MTQEAQEKVKEAKPFAVPDPATIPLPDLSRKFTSEELQHFDGNNSQPIYVAIKGQVFDVSAKAAMYGPEGSYSVFAGRDASCALGRSSLNPQDVKADFSELTPGELQVLDDWMLFFQKRYAVVGQVADNQ